MSDVKKYFIIDSDGIPVFYYTATPLREKENPEGDANHLVRCELHREDGPALFKNKTWIWYNHDKEHRVNGFSSYDEKTNSYEWQIHGIPVEGMIGKWAVENEIDLHNMTPEEILLVELTWNLPEDTICDMMVDYELTLQKERNECT